MTRCGRVKGAAADLAIDDGGDVQVDENFNSNAATLAYDDNGNLTDDGVYKFAYDAWNRMVQVKRRPDAATAIATYAYDAVNRRQSKVVANCGIENTAGDGGDTTVHFYYGSATGMGSIGVLAGSVGGAGILAGGVGGTGILAGGSVPWNIFETRNGELTGLQARTPIPQWVRGTQYIDEILFMDVNGDPLADNDADIDVTTGNESGESPADKRYFYHQDRNWNVVALTEYSPPGSPSNVSGRVAERYIVTPAGVSTLRADSGGGELGSIRNVSTLNVLPLAISAGFLPAGGKPDRRWNVWPDNAPDSGPFAVLCCHTFHGLGLHCQLRVIQRHQGRCYATDFEGSNPTGQPSYSNPNRSRNQDGSPCVDPPPPQPYEIPCTQVCRAGAPHEDNFPVSRRLTSISPSARDCLARARGCAAEYGVLSSNSNAILAMMMWCCGVTSDSESLHFPYDAPGWTGIFGSRGATPDGQMPCIDMDPAPLCTRCATCQDLGL